MPGDIGKAFAQRLSVVRSRSGTAETGVVVLITQRSQVQILPPLPGKTASGATLPGPFSATCDQALVTSPPATSG